MARFLVTGGAGFIGSHIVEKLVSAGEDVIVIDNLSTGFIENISKFLDKIKFVKCDICDFEKVQKEVNGVDYILHQAAISSIPRSIENPLLTNKVNIEGTLNLLVLAKAEGVKKFVFASSSSVYGNVEKFPISEQMQPSPISPYAISKFTGELYGKIFSEIYGLEFVALRYFNVFGERQNPFSEYSPVIAKFIIEMLKGNSPVIFGDGSQSRDFCYVENVVNANLLAVKSKNNKGKIYNIACGETFSLITLINFLNDIMGTNIKPVFASARPGDIKKSLASIENAKKDLGYKVEVNFKEGLKKTVDYFRRHEF